MKIHCYFLTKTPQSDLLETSGKIIEMTARKFVVMLPHLKQHGMLLNGTRFYYDHTKMGWDPDTSEPETALYFFREMEAEEFEKEKRAQKEPGESI